MTRRCFFVKYKKVITATLALTMVFNHQTIGLANGSINSKLAANELVSAQDIHSQLDSLITEIEFYAIINNYFNSTKKFDAKERAVSREDACVILSKYVEAGTGRLVTFKDSADISPRAKQAVYRLYYLGIIDGYPDKTFKPQRSLTMGEAIKMISATKPHITYEKVRKVEPSPEMNQTVRVDTVDDDATTIEAPIIDSEIPTIGFEAKMGSQFRSLDISLKTSDNDSSPKVYYSILKSGGFEPNVANVINGTVGISGVLTGNSNKWNRDLTLSFSGEKGLIDGYNYDIYMVAVDDKKQYSEMAQVKKVMAMPFSAKNDSTATYTIRSLMDNEIKNAYPDLLENSNQNDMNINQNGRQLQNIQRLSDLFESTSGLHGSEDFLNSTENTFVLSGDLDLKSYMPVKYETGWSPIGTEENPFCGKFDGNNNTISGIYIDRDASVYDGTLIHEGLFGKTQDASIKNVKLDNPIIISNGLMENSHYSCVGALVGESVRSEISNIKISSPVISASSKSDGNQEGICVLGGLVGNSIDSSMSQVTITNAEIKNSGENSSDVVGGVVGRYYIGESEKKLFNNFFVSGNINASGKAAGGVAGTLDMVPEDSASVFAQNINSQMNINGNARFSGGIIGNAGYEQLIFGGSKITFDNAVATGNVRGTDYCGGLFGKINTLGSENFIVKNSSASVNITSISDNCVIGGFIGLANGGSFEDCKALGSGITAVSDNVGGFVGVVNGEADFIGCSATKNVQAETNVGGFVGKQEFGRARFFYCDVNASVSGQSNVGDFAGYLDDEKQNVELVSCQTSDGDTLD